MLCDASSQFSTIGSQTVWLTSVSFRGEQSSPIGYADVVLRSYDANEIEYIFNQLSSCRDKVDSHSVSFETKAALSSDNRTVKVFNENPIEQYHEFRIYNIQIPGNAVVRSGQPTLAPLTAFRNFLVDFVGAINISNTDSFVSSVETTALSSVVSWTNTTTPVIFMDNITFTTRPDNPVDEIVITFPAAPLLLLRQHMAGENNCVVEVHVPWVIDKLNETVEIDDFEFGRGIFSPTGTELDASHIIYSFNVSDFGSIEVATVITAQLEYENVILAVPSFQDVWCNGSSLDIRAVGNGFRFDDFEYVVSPITGEGFTGHVQKRSVKRVVELKGNGVPCYAIGKGERDSFDVDVFFVVSVFSSIISFIAALAFLCFYSLCSGRHLEGHFNEK